MSGLSEPLVRPAPDPKRRHVPAAFVPAVLVAPGLLAVFLVIGVPLAYSFVVSLNRTNVLTHRSHFVGLANYTAALTDPDFFDAFLRTALFAGGTVLAGLAIGIGMALVLNARIPGRGFMRGLVLIPWAMSPVAVGILWSWIFNGEYGPLDAMLLDLGVIHHPIYWLGGSTSAFVLVALVYVWNQAPLTCLLVLGGLQSMPENLHKAARVDGAGPWRRFWRITLPWLRPTLLLVLILTTINAIMAFDLFWIITQGGPGDTTTVISWLGYVQAFQYFQFGQGAAILYLLTILCLMLAIAYFLLLLAPERRRAKRVSAALRAETAPLAASLRVRTPPPLEKRRHRERAADAPWRRRGLGADCRPRRSTGDAALVGAAVSVAAADEPVTLHRAHPQPAAADAAII